MDNSKKEPEIIVIDGSTDVIILDESTGLTDRTRRPITGARLPALKERLAREAALEKRLDEQKKRDGSKPAQS